MKIICDWNNCFEEGSYKAPIEKDNSKKYRMLCLNHIKEFNKVRFNSVGLFDIELINIEEKK